ncbi:hypothetical protein FD755_012979, partial [Muntiacus reevesi]
MGASGSKARGLWPFTSAAGGGGPEAAVAEQALDGDLAHEFYEKTIVTKNGQKPAKLRRVHKNLIPQ